MLGRSFAKIPLRHQSNSHPIRARCAHGDTRGRTPTSRSSTAAKLPGTWGEGESIFSSQNGAGAPHTALCSGASPHDGGDNSSTMVNWFSRMTSVSRTSARVKGRHHHIEEVQEGQPRQSAAGLREDFSCHRIFFQSQSA